MNRLRFDSQRGMLSIVKLLSVVKHDCRRPKNVRVSPFMLGNLNKGSLILKSLKCKLAA